MGLYLPSGKAEAAAEQSLLKDQQPFNSGLQDGSACANIWLGALFPGSHSQMVPVLDTERCSSEECLSGFLHCGLGDLRRFNGVDTAPHQQSHTAQGLELAGCKPAWIEDRMILVWPAKDHRKISLKTRSDCPFKGVGERVFFQTVLFPL